MSRGIELTSSNGISVGSADAVADAVDNNGPAWCGMKDDVDPELLPFNFPRRAYDMTSHRLFYLDPHYQGHLVDNHLFVFSHVGPLLIIPRYHPRLVVCVLLYMSIKVF